MEWLILFGVLATIFDAVNKKNKQKRQREALEARERAEEEARAAGGSTSRAEPPVPEPAAAVRSAASRPQPGRKPPALTKRPGLTEVGEMDAAKAVLGQIGLGDFLPGLEAGRERVLTTQPGADHRPPSEILAQAEIPARARAGSAARPPAETLARSAAGFGSPPRSAPPRELVLPEYRAPTPAVGSGRSERALTGRSQEGEATVRRRRTAGEPPAMHGSRTVRSWRRDYGTDPSSRAPSDWGQRRKERAAGSDVRAMLASADLRSLKNAIILREVFGEPLGLKGSRKSGGRA